MTVFEKEKTMSERDKSREMTTQQLACTYLREQILTGKFGVGMRLKTEELAEALGISRMPVRDALQQLHSEGLVEIRPNRGAIVTRLSANEILEMFEIRATLEGLAARHACVNFGSDDLYQLERMRDEMHRSTDDLDLWLKLHDKFHDFVCLRSNRPRLFRQIRTARQAVTPYVRMYISVYHRMEMPRAEHDLLISVAFRGYPDLFEATMRDHVLSAGNGVSSFLNQRALDAGKVSLSQPLRTESQPLKD